VRQIRKIAVIGATGRLGAPVVAELAKAFEVRAIVRSPEKAKTKLPPNVEIVRGDLRDIASLRTGLEGRSHAENPDRPALGNPGARPISPRMKFVGHLFAYFANHKDPFYANRTWQDLGKPRTTLEMFARSLARTATAL